MEEIKAPKAGPKLTKNFKITESNFKYKFKVNCLKSEM